MNLTDNTRLLLTTELLNLDPRIVDKRLVINEVLIELALFYLAYPSTIEEISNEIDRIVNQNKFQKTTVYEKGIQECLKKKTININDDNKYFLSESRRDKFKEVNNQNDQIYQNVRKGFIESIENEIGAPFDDVIANEIFSMTIRILTEEVYEFSLQLIREKNTLDEMIVRFEDSVPFQKIENFIKNKLPKERGLLSNKVIGGLCNYFRSLPDDLKKLLQLINSNLIFNQILNLDPSIINLQKAWISKRILYLDTNVVLSLLYEAHSNHSTVKEIIIASKALGVQLFISPATQKELDGQINKAKNNYRQYSTSKLPSQVITRGDDVILATFVNLKRLQPSLIWETFISPFNSLEELLLQNEILIEKNGFEESKKDTLLNDFENAIKNCKPPSATKNIIEHDTNNFLLIKYLRKDYLPDTRGQILWLLTIDTSLRSAQKYLYSRKIIQNPLCMQISDWGEIVYPIQSILGLKFPDFIGYIAQARLGAFIEPEVIQLDFLETIYDSYIDIDRLITLRPEQVIEVIKILQSNREVKALISDRNDLSEDKIKEKQIQLDSIIGKAISESDPIESLKKEFDRRYSILSKKLENKDQEISLLQKKLDRTLIYRINSFFKRIFNNLLSKKED